MKSKCPRPSETHFQELFEGELLYRGKNPSPTVQHLHRASVPPFMGATEWGESIGEKEERTVEDGGRKKEKLTELSCGFLGAPQNTVYIPPFPL